MKPWKTLATDGTWTLRQRGPEFMVLLDGKIHLTSRQSGDEEELMRIACARINRSHPQVLLGGLGFGFMLRAALDVLPDGAKVVVSEVSPRVVDWHRGALAELHGNSLEDPRVSVDVGDVQQLLSKHRGAFDVVVLDLDNGPFHLEIDDDQTMYSLGGMSSVRASLRPGGRLAVWSKGTEHGFNKRLREVGFEASVQKSADGQHLVFIGDV